MKAVLALAIAAGATNTNGVAPVAIAAVTEATTLPDQDIRALPAKTAVEIEIVENISSKTAKIGDTFAIRLREPVWIDGRLVLPIGTMGRGEVSHVARARWGGKPGELIVMARYLTCGDQKIPLGHFHYGSSGEGHVGKAFAAEMIIPFTAFLIDGDEMLVPAGTLGTARVSADVALSPVAEKQCTSVSNS